MGAFEILPEEQEWLDFLGLCYPYLDASKLGVKQKKRRWKPLNCLI